MIRSIIFILIFITTILNAKEEIRIGVLAHKQFEDTYDMWYPTAEYLEQAIDDYSFSIVPLRFEQFPEYLRDKKIDFVIINPAYYIDLEHRYGISRIATLKNSDLNGRAKTEFGGVIFTPSNSSDIKSIRDLKYKKIAAVDEDSFGGWIMALRELNNSGINRKNIDVKYYGTHEAVVRAVLAGDADAGSVRTDTLERMIESSKIDARDFHIVSPKYYDGFDYYVSTRLYPEWPIATAKHTSSMLAEQVAVTLISMREDSHAARASKSLGWTIPLDYQTIHEALRELELGPYKNLKKDALLYYIKKYWIIIVSGFFITLASILVAIYIYKINKKLKNTQDELESLNLSLEQKVYEKTLSLQEKSENLRNALDNERYLRGILRTVADVNQILITADGIEELCDKSMQSISDNESFKLAKISLVYDEMLTNISSYGEWNAKEMYQLEEIVFNSKENLLINDIEHFEFNKECLEAINSYGIKGVYIMALRPSANSDKVLGVLSICTAQESGFSIEELSMIEELAGDIGFAINAHNQQREIENLNTQRLDGYENIIDAMVNMIEQRDTYTAGHTKRVADYSRAIASEMGISDDDIRVLVFAAKLHDIGKIVTPDSILLKPGMLNKLEYELIQEHVSAGYELLSSIKGYEFIASIVRDHHERYDGSGYPRGKRADEVSMLSHIMAVADSFDAMTTNRIYKPRKNLDESLLELQSLSGKWYHPDVVDAAIIALKDVYIDATITQNAGSVIEEERMSYFFKDRLSGLYNEDFLLMYIRGLTRFSEPKKLTIISIINFYKYNKRYGWDGGNELIAKMGLYLKSKLDSNVIFRAWGDQFIIGDFDGDIDELLSDSIVTKSNLTIDVREVFDIPDNLEDLS